MAISFNNSNLSNPTYATHNVSEFNGVDYTTTPTNVDDTRAVDISNYLPEGQAIVKRKGTESYYSNINNNSFTEYYLTPIVGSKSVMKIMKFKGFELRVIKIKLSNTAFGSNVKSLLSMEYYNKTNNTWVEFQRATMMTHIDISDTEIVFAKNPKNISTYEKDNKLFYLIDCDEPVYGYIEIYNSVPKCRYILTGNRNWGTIGGVETYAPTIATQVPYKVIDNDEYSNERIDTLEAINLISNEVVCKATFVATRDNFTTWENDTISWELEFDFNNFGNFDYINYRYDKDATLSFDFDKERNEWLSISNNKFTLEFDTTASNMTDDDYVTFTFTFKLSLLTEPTLFNDFTRFDVYDEKLWFYGSNTYVNVDLHTDYASYASERYLDFTYIPDTSYQAFGSSANKIVGYGTLSNGNQLVIKEFYNSEPNVFIRTKNTTTSTNEYGMPEVKTTYPITQSGISMDIKGYDNVIQFGDYALVNTPKGIYAVNIGTSTATQTYGMLEMSYFIRNDLGTNLTGSWYLVKDNMLYVSRLNKDNKRRVYVADLNRMALVEGHYQFEWWVLDDLNYDKAELIDDKIIFTNDYGTFKFSDNYYDKIDNEAIMTYVNNDGGNVSNFITTELTYTSDVSIDNDDDATTSNKILTLSPTSVIFEQIKNNNNFEDVKQFYDNFKKNIKITPMYYVPLGRAINEKGDNQIIEYLTTNSSTYSSLYMQLPVESEENIANVYYYKNTANGDCVDIIPDELYYYSTATNKYYEFSKCYIEGNEWYYEGAGDFTQLGNVGDIVFNNFTLKLRFKGYEVSFIDDVVLRNLPKESVDTSTQYALDLFCKVDDDETLKKIYFEYIQPVKSYWYSKHTCLNDISTLKTMTNMYFVPEARHGGETYVGYRTTKRENQYFTNIKGEAFDFNDVNFDDFSFGERMFGRTCSSKKKVKNFAFIQLKIYSNEMQDSSASMISFKYRYSKNNKGVK